MNGAPKNAILRDDDGVDRSNVRMNRCVRVCVCVRNDYDRHYMSQSWNTDGFAEDQSKYDFPVVIIFINRRY